MTEDDPFIIEMNITHYRELLKLDIDDQKRSVVERLLAEVESNLVLAKEMRTGKRARKKNNTGVI